MTLYLVLQAKMPEAAAGFYAHATGTVFAGAVGAALTWLPAVHYVSFRNKAGTVMLEVLEPRLRRREYREFMKRLQSAIRLSKTGRHALRPPERLSILTRLSETRASCVADL